MSEESTLPHPAVLTDEDFNHLYFILGAYLGMAIREAERVGSRDPFHTPAVNKARELTLGLKAKLEELQHTR